MIEKRKRETKPPAASFDIEGALVRGSGLDEFHVGQFAQADNTPALEIVVHFVANTATRAAEGSEMLCQLAEGVEALAAMTWSTPAPAKQKRKPAAAGGRRSPKSQTVSEAIMSGARKRGIDLNKPPGLSQPKRKRGRPKGSKTKARKTDSAEGAKPGSLRPGALQSVVDHACGGSKRSGLWAKPNQERCKDAV